MRNKIIKKAAIPIILLFSFILALIIRMIPYQNFIGSKGQFYFYGADSYDHLRQITLSVTQFPSVPTYDFYRGYPQGTGVIWSPFFDSAIAIIAMIFGFGDPTQRQIEAISFFIPPILGALTLFPLYVWVRNIFDDKTALLSAAILCILPGHIVYSLVSQIDNNVIEPILALVFFNIFLGALNHTNFLESEDVNSTNKLSYYLKAFTAGIVMALILFFWRGSTIFWGAVIIFTFCQFLLDAWYGRPLSNLLKTVMLTFSTAAGIIAAFCIMNPWNLPMGISFGVISWFHPILLLGYLLFLFLLVFIPKHTHKDRPLKRSHLIGGLTIALILVPLALLFIKSLFQGISVIGGRDPWLDNISELRSMLLPEKRLDIMNPALELTWVFWLSPIILSQIIYKAWRSGFKSLYINFFVIWVPYSLVIAILRERYVHIAALGISALTGYLLLQLFEKMKHLKMYGTTLSIIVLLFLISPTVSYLKAIPGFSLEDWRQEDLYDAMNWLRSNTPKTSYFDNPVQRPEYGIIADWGIGSYIEYLGERPTVATNFGWETYGLIPSTRFITATSEETGNAILNENRVRYVVIKNPLDRLYNSAEIAGVNPEDYIRQTGTGQMTPGPNFAKAMFVRLYLFDGTSANWQGTDVPSLGHYRLVYESRNFIRPGNLPIATSVIKIFEYVPGVKITGRAGPNEAISAETVVETNRKRRFKYINSANADAKGAFELILPYSTIGTPYSVRAIGPYVIKAGGKVIFQDVSEGDVAGGRPILCLLSEI